MIVLSIGSDAHVFDNDSGVRGRLLLQSKLFDELHVFVASKHTKIKAKQGKIGNSLFIIPIRSRFKPILFVKALFGFYKYAKALKKRNPDIYITSQDPFEIGLISLIVAKMLKLKLQFQFHTDCFNLYYIKHGVFNYFRASLARLMMGQATSIRTVSEKIKSSIVMFNPGIESRISVLPVWLDIRSIQLQELKFESNLKVKFPDFDKIILIVARLESEKNIKLAIISFQKILRQTPNILLVIAGSGNDEEWLKEYSKYLGIWNNVRFLGWQSDVVSLYKSSDLLLVTSLYEGYGLNIVEATSCNLPVVSTDVGVAREAGAVIVSYDPGEIALSVVETLKSNKPPIKKVEYLNEDEYLSRFKQTFS